MNSYLKFFSGREIQSSPRRFDRYDIRCYFDNDSDELINYSSRNGQVDLHIYREMVRSLKAMGYNAIDIHDQLGRPEFYLWDAYKENWNFEASLDHISQLIDLIHEEGMMVQIPMYLGWAFHPLDERHECYAEHKGEWLDTWKFYMESPLGKGDIFLLRPRSPIYDCAYRCSCEVCMKRGVGDIMTEVFEEIEGIILSGNEEAVLICDLYAEGLELFEERSFNVSER